MVGLTGGLAFRAHHADGKIIVRGVSVHGARVRSLTLVKGRLVIVLRRPSGGVTVGLASAALHESSHLRSQAAHRRLKSLGITVAVADTAGRVSHLRLQIHKLGISAARR